MCGSHSCSFGGAKGAEPPRFSSKCLEHFEIPLGI